MQRACCPGLAYQRADFYGPPAPLGQYFRPLAASLPRRNFEVSAR